MRLLAELERVAGEAFGTALGSPAPALVRPADPAHGDYQVNGVLPLAKQLGKPPRPIAEQVAAALGSSPFLESASVAGPGFINMRLAPSFVASALSELLADPAREGVPTTEHPKRVVVDFSAPNIAKEMHVGHIRSTILGDALCRLLRFVGHEVLGDNHLGDFGTQFGLLIVGMRDHGSTEALAAQPVAELERVYKLASNQAKNDPEVAARARAELKKLQDGDPENRGLWQRFIEATRTELDRIYARLDVRFDLWLGESAYEAMLPGVVEQLLAQGIARKDQGAVCVFFDDDPELSSTEAPFIVQKQDGAFLYSTTDIATVLYRRDTLGAERILYVVDKRQALHFKQLFATVKKLGVTLELEHIPFGTILGADGRPLKTRDGGTIKLAALLDEAEERAEALMKAEGIEVDRELKRLVSVGAVKYADLCQNRSSDYRFDWSKLISLKGNSGPYLQYAHARAHAIFRKGEIELTSFAENARDAIELSEPSELVLGKRLLCLADVVHQAAEASTPHVLCEHLYALARDMSTFYEQCPVLKAEGNTRQSRLALCALTARQLARGLGLLGIAAPQRM